MMKALVVAMVSMSSACTLDQGGDGLDPSQSMEGGLAQSGELPDLIRPRAFSTHAIINTNRTRAGEVYFNRPGGDVNCEGLPCLAVFDAKDDRESIYVLYRINNGDEKRSENFGGPGTLTRMELQNKPFSIQYRACINVNNAPDSCTPQVQDATP